MFVPIESSQEKDPRSVDDPETGALFAHWLERADGRWAPAWRDIDIMQLPSPLLPYVTVCDVTTDGDFVYRYWGRGHTSYHSVDYTHRRLSSMRPVWVRDLLIHQYMRVVESRKPLLFETRYESIDKPNYSLRLPLSDDGELLTGVLGIACRGKVSGPLRDWIEIQRTQKLHSGMNLDEEPI